MKQTIIAILLSTFIFSCENKIEPSWTFPTKNMEKHEGYSVERTNGINLHITGTSSFPSTTYSFYDTIFIYNSGVMNIIGGAYIHAERYVPKLTGGGKATINLGDGNGIAKLTIKRINDLGNTDVTLKGGTFRHDYLYSSNSNATIQNGVYVVGQGLYYGIHECQGEGMIWGNGNYYLNGQVVFSKSVESSVIPTIRFNGGNFWFDQCGLLYTEDLITNANSVAKGTGRITVHRLAHFNQPLTSHSTIRACINAFATPTQNKTGSATLSCTQGCN